MKSILFQVLAAAGLSLSAAQSSTTTSGSTTGTATTSAATHTVSVGVDNAYEPATITADVGDTISNDIFLAMNLATAS
jgi:plastocyanin